MGSSLEDWCLLAALAVWIRAAVAIKAAHQVIGWGWPSFGIPVPATPI